MRSRHRMSTARSAEADRELVERHVRACGPCRGRVQAEQAVHALMRERRAASPVQAPAALRARCAAAARSQPSPRVGGAPGAPRLTPLALAASLVLVVAGAFVYELTAHSTQVDGRRAHRGSPEVLPRAQ